MLTIQQIQIADCDRSTDDNGNYTSPAWAYVVCQDNDIQQAIEYCDTLAAAEAVLAEIA